MAEDFYDGLTSQLRQGDIFSNIAFFSLVRSEDGSIVAHQSKKSHLALLLNQSCDIDKPSTTKLVVVPVLPLTLLQAANQANVRKNKILAHLHLPAYRDLVVESFVHLAEPCAIEKDILHHAQRIVSLSDKGRRSLYDQHLRWLSRWQMESMLCPSCGVSFDPSATLPVIND